MGYAQLDREHWFGPMVDRVNSFGVINNDHQAIYMSTGETTPFKVDVYFNNAVVATYTISKNAPQKHIISSADRNKIIINPNWNTNPAAGLFQPVKMGLYLKGEKPFFASLRFSIYNHAEIVTSKGTAALGTEFRLTMAPIVAFSSLGIMNFMSSVMATENNTRVTISEYDPKVIFTDEIPRTEITFELNKGESYIVEGPDSYYENHSGFIGAKIVSDKPVVVTNGNFNGQYATYVSSSDILMDQAVPIKKLGKTFVLVKGNGNNSFTPIIGDPTTMEKAVIVAVKNNTKIYLNGASTPAATLNAGQFFTTPPNSYVDQGSGHYNMYISSSEDIYVYQLLAGLVGHISNPEGEATGGFNYIPPLSCYLPRKIDEIGLIDENLFYSNYNTSGILNIPTKLNVITEKGAVIEIKKNGTSLPITAVNGPHNVSGNSDWETYSFPDISGNIAIFSTKAVTAGITAGNDAVGYGGFFAGFSYTPLITKIEGECLPDAVKLAVTEGFAHYLWLIKVGTTYVPAPGVNNTFEYFPTQAGIYAVQIQQGSCAMIQTQDFKFFNCTNFTNYNYSICTVQKITPKFALSTQAVNPATVTITEPPTKGTVTIAANGTLTYTANQNATGIDTFKFSFCGIGALPDCEVVQATIQLNQIVHYDVELHACSTTTNGVFNLNNAEVSPDAGIQKKYFRNLALTLPIPANQVENYPGFDGELIYVSLKNSFGCEAVSVVTLRTDSPPTVNENLYVKTHCDEEIDGIIDGKYRVNLNTITPIVVPNTSGLTIRYYDTEAKAIAGGNNNITGVFVFTTNNSPIWIWVKANNVCPPVIRKIILRTGTKFNIKNPVNTFTCDNDRDQSAEVNLDDYVGLFTSDNASVKYFDDLIKAQNSISGENINANQTITGNKTFYYRFKKAGFCESIGTLNLTMRQPRISPDLKDKEICENATTTLDAGTGFDGYLWSNGATTSFIENVPIGDYWVDLSSNDCTYRQFVSVKAVELPTIVNVEIKGSTVTINATGGNPPLQYALDNFNYQFSNVFSNVQAGDHTVYVISNDHCDPISANINVIEVYNVISPNADGINDVLNYSALLLKDEPSIQIYDRYGKTVFIGDKNNRYSWDGKTSGRPVSTGSYWFVLKWKEPGFNNFTEYKGWILVKNRN